MSRVMNTVSAYRSLLREEDYDIKQLGINRLLDLVSLHWSDIANDIEQIESLLDDYEFPNKYTVAILLSKLYFYLNQYEQALGYALQAGNYFDIKGGQDEFTEILVNQCVEKYIKNRRSKLVDSDEHRRYNYIVAYVVDKHIREGDYKLPLGIALDTQDLPLFERIVKLYYFNDLVAVLLPHLLGLEIEFRRQVLKIATLKLPERFATIGQYVNVLQLLEIKGDYEAVAKIIYECVKRSYKEIAYTLALEVSEMHGLNQKVLISIPIYTQWEAYRKVLQEIIEGRFADEVNNIVLKAYARTDPHYLSLLKRIYNKNSIAHGSAVLALSMLQAYTQNDSFLQIKYNLYWASKCTHWNKFSCIASLGLIFRNNKNKDIFKRFLPESNTDLLNNYPNGGALYGLGLLFTGTANQDIVDYIIGITTNPVHNTNEMVMHGACLGLGLTAFASGNEIIGERLKDILNSDTSIMGYASALALGLTFAGTNNDSVLSDLIATAQDTEHEKIMRSVCMSIGIISFLAPSSEFLANIYGNPTIRLAIPFYLSCAYFKTSNPEVVRHLLRLSNDISNYVKRAATIGLGFVMYHDEQLTTIVKMLMYSYNPFVRYGCVMALAIGAKDPKETIDLLWPMLTDTVDFVRQGVYIALAMLLQVTTVNLYPRLADFRKIIEYIIAKPHGYIMAKMGAILSFGMLDIGGRNMAVSLTTRSGLPKLESVVGMLVFTQFWNWFPYINFIGLTLTPSIFIGVTAYLKIPKSFQLKSACRPSLFDYPNNIVPQEKKKDDKKDTAKELSTTAKAKVRALNKKNSDMEAELPSSIIKKPSLISGLSSVEKFSYLEATEKKEKKEQEEKDKAEKKYYETFSILNNPVRIAERQRKYITFLEGRYTPILADRKIGINFLLDTAHCQPDDYLNEKVKDIVTVSKKPLESIEEESKSGEKDGMMPPYYFEYDEGEGEKDKLIKKGE